MSPRAQVVTCDRLGGPEVLSVISEPLGDPGPGQVQVYNRVIGVNPYDWKVFSGALGTSMRVSFPHTPGSESSGVVYSVGPGVEGFESGDEVVYSGSKAYRSAMNVDAQRLLHKPVSISFEQAAVLPVAGGTAYAAAMQLGLSSLDTLLILGGSGGVGSALIQIARNLGTKVIATASPANHDRLQGLGAIPLAHGEASLTAIGAEVSVTAVVDLVGDAAEWELVRTVMRSTGRVVTAVANERTSALGIGPIAHRVDELGAVLELAGNGQLTMEITRRFPLGEVAQALRMSMEGHPRGKLVLLVEDLARDH
ncbi:MAG: NADP-dependent oxidoreductase [Acidimicrobiales bacterium]